MAEEESWHEGGREDRFGDGEARFDGGEERARLATS